MPFFKCIFKDLLTNLNVGFCFFPKRDSWKPPTYQTKLTSFEEDCHILRRPLRMNFYDKRDALNFTNANYLHVRSNIPTSSVYKVYISVDTIFKSFWFLNRLVAANKKATESMVPRWMFCGRHSFILFLQYIL